jgi:dehydrogenase/reductase SDR family member 4
LSKFGKVEGFACNVAKREERLKIVDHIKQKYGKLDVLVPNVAVSSHFGSQFEITEKAYDILWNVNVKSTFFLI